MEETPNEQYQRLIIKAKKPSKYKNKPVIDKGIRYDSKAEYAYKGILDLLVKAKQIKGYDFHIKFPLIAAGGELLGYYEVDYLIYNNDGTQEMHDVKGVSTPLFNWKAKHIKAQYGSAIILIDPKTLRPKK